MRRFESSVLVWSDASYEGSTAVLGWVVYDPVTDALWHSSYVCPDSVFDNFVPDKKQYIGQLELLAACAVYTSLPEMFRNRPVLHWIDNQQALTAAVSGYARQPDNAKLVNQLSLSGATLQAQIYFEYVRSLSNPADFPSRLDSSFLTNLGSTHVPTTLPDFSCWL